MSRKVLFWGHVKGSSRVAGWLAHGMGSGFGGAGERSQGPLGTPEDSPPFQTVGCGSKENQSRQGRKKSAQHSREHRSLGQTPVQVAFPGPNAAWPHGKMLAGNIRIAALSRRYVSACVGAACRIRSSMLLSRAVQAVSLPAGANSCASSFTRWSASAARSRKTPPANTA